MKHGAIEDPRIGHPNATPVLWRCRRKSSPDEVVTVKTRMFIDARREAARVLKCDPHDVLCVVAEES
jgi:hypothetical protein